MKLRERIRRLRARGWSGWPEKAYRQKRFQQRLAAVQKQFGDCLHAAPPGPLRVLSVCAGDGRNTIGVLISHPRRNDVVAWLVELNRESVTAGIERAAAAGLEKTVNFVHADATDYATYQRIAPADIVLACGVWGHVPVEERARFVQALGSLCTPGGMVIWTCGIIAGRSRSREIEALFVSPTWDAVRVDLTPDKTWTVATHRFRGPVVELPQSGRIFHFQTGAGRSL